MDDGQLGLIKIEVGITNNGMYSTVYLLPAGLAAMKLEEGDFKKLVDDIGAAVAKVLSAGHEAEDGSAKSYGPGADALAAALGEEGFKVEVVERKDDLSEFPKGLPVH